MRTCSSVPTVVSAGNLPHHGQDRAHLPPGGGADREERAYGCCCHRGGAGGAAALLSGSVWSSGALLQKAHSTSCKTWEPFLFLYNVSEGTKFRHLCITHILSINCQCHKRSPQLADDDTEVSFSDRELELDEPGDLSSLPWNERLGDGFLSPLPSSGRSASLAAQLRTERSGRDTPASVDSIPLEWDHDYDLSRGLESASRALREQQSEEGDFLQRPASALSGTLSNTHPCASSIIRRREWQCIKKLCYVILWFEMLKTKKQEGRASFNRMLSKLFPSLSQRQYHVTTPFHRLHKSSSCEQFHWFSFYVTISVRKNDCKCIAGSILGLTLKTYCYGYQKGTKAEDTEAGRLRTQRTKVHKFKIQNITKGWQRLTWGRRLRERHRHKYTREGKPLRHRWNCSDRAIKKNWRTRKDSGKQNRKSLTKYPNPET